MEVPCPVPLSEPWSPVGYRVVQVGDDKTPTSEQPPQVTLAAPSSQPIPKLTTPRSPVGYKVVMVAEDTVPVIRREPPRREMRKIWLPERRPPRSGSFAPLLIVGVLGLVILLPALALAMMISTRPRPQMAAPVAVVIPDEIAVVPDGIGDKAAEIKPMAVKPAPAPVADKAAPVQAQPEGNPQRAADPDCPDCIEAKIPAGGPDREAFDTAVKFVRNPQEAARVAKDENKLTFLLHLSGNFEDPGFT